MMRTAVLGSVGKGLFPNGSQVKNSPPSFEGPKFSNYQN